MNARRADTDQYDADRYGAGRRDARQRDVGPDGIGAPALVRPVWRRLRLWLALAAVIVLAALVVSAAHHPSGATLDPASTQPVGGRALAAVLGDYGTTVRTTSALGRARSGTVLVTDPDAYSDAQLRGLSRAGARLVLVRPTTAAAAFGLHVQASTIPFTTPQCNIAGAVATGRISLPEDSLTYTGRGTSCYDGLLVLQPGVVVIGSSSALQNSGLGALGHAALAVNAITADRTVRSVTWLLPGADAGARPTSIWLLFPSGAYRVFWWSAVVAVLLILWRARRLGGIVSEPLPVVVRACELVEGHGRLYARAGARDRSAATLRRATADRLRRRLMLPADASAEQLAAAAAPVAGWSQAQVWALLAGPPPADDDALVRLARDLDRLEVDTSADRPHTPGGTTR